MEKAVAIPYKRSDDDSEADLENTSRSMLLDHPDYGVSRRRSWRIPIAFLIHVLLACFYLAWTFVLLHSPPRKVVMDLSPGPDLVHCQ